MKENNIKFIYWFAYYNLDSPSVRYRAKYPLEYFKDKHNIGYHLVIPGYSISRIIKFLIAYFSALIFIKKDSIIVIQRVQSNFFYSNLLKFLVFVRKSYTVYDLDDADYLDKNPNTIYYFAKKCNAVSAGSEKIAQHLRIFNSKIIHTSSPIVDLSIVKEKKSKLFTIGWIGGFGGEHKEGMIQTVFPAIKKLDFEFKFIILGVKENSDVDFINNYFINNRNIQIVIPLTVDWNNERYIQNFLKTFDVGIATLIDSEMQISKSGIKAKQYMNNGVPVLSTKLPENDSVVIEGKNGFFCSTSDDFRQRLIEFYNMDVVTYETFINNARKSISNFDHNKYLMDLNKIKNGTKQFV